MSNANPSANAATLAGHPQNTRDAASEFDEILALAREAGMLITLDGQIGREKYQSIAGSLQCVPTLRASALRCVVQASAR